MRQTSTSEKVSFQILMQQTHQLAESQFAKTKIQLVVGVKMQDNQKITKQNYKQYVFEKMPKSSHCKNMFWAFVIGGTICAIGQGFIELYSIWFTDVDASDANSIDGTVPSAYAVTVAFPESFSLLFP